MRDRAWLRKIVNLGARAREEHIRPEVIELQEDTVLAALDILDREPGVLLADEVGMGKTFQTLGIIGCMLEHNPKARVLVVTPTPELNEQWYWFGQRFREHGFYPFKQRAFAVAGSLRELPSCCRSHPIVFAPVTIFTGARARDERGFLLALWRRHRGISGKRLAEVTGRIEKAGIAVAPGKAFLGHPLDDFKAKGLGRAFRRDANEVKGFKGFDDLLEEGLDAFSSPTAARRALDRARFHVVRALLRPFSLLVVDEAHKLKNPWTVRSQAVTQVLCKNYDKAIFLTATPFQLGIEELKQVFQLFANARSVRNGFLEDVERLYSSVRSYQEAYGRFESAWRYATAEQAEAIATWYQRASHFREAAVHLLADPNVKALAAQAWELIRIKREHVEPAFRQWTLRSLKPGKRLRRQTKIWRLQPDDDAAVPMALYQRLLLEDARTKRRSSLATVDINMSSSYGAARAGRLLRERSQNPSVRAYQRVVQRALQSVRRNHPKVAHVIGEVLAAARAGEKTLIFCERNSTFRVLQEGLETGWIEEQLKIWKQVCPGYSFEEIFGPGAGRQRGEAQRIPPRFYRGSDELSVALTECHAYTLFADPAEGGELPRDFWRASGKILQDANKILIKCKAPPSAAIRLDYPLAARCIDQAVVRYFQKHRPDLFKRHGEMVRLILDNRYLSHGMAIADNASEASTQRSKELWPINWQISRSTFDTVLAPRQFGIWFPFKDKLAQFPPGVRHLIVEAVRYFLTRREVAFLAELLARVGGPKASSSQLRHAVEIWWMQETCSWRQKINELLQYLPCLTRAEQKEVLRDMLRSPRVVQNSLAASSRIARQNSFNAPFYPMVLIGNQSIQQGLDLHRQCRRVIHYDLRWNPSDLEQRIGRIERHGCLAERFEADDPAGKVHVLHPLLERTTDPQLYRSVKMREKWMDFLLGQPSMITEPDASWVAPQPLPQKLVEHLRVELGPQPR